jgi:hypothetical protein
MSNRDYWRTVHADIVKKYNKDKKEEKPKGPTHLFCINCLYVHPLDTGLDDGDICPDCNNGIMMEN